MQNNGGLGVPFTFILQRSRLSIFFIALFVGQWITQPCGQETHHHDARINFMALYESLGAGKNMAKIEMYQSIFFYAVLRFLGRQQIGKFGNAHESMKVRWFQDVPAISDACVVYQPES